MNTKILTVIIYYVQKGENIMNIQLNDLNEVLLCKGIILKRKDINEEWQARISDFMECKDMYVKDIFACDSNVVLVIQKEPIDI